MSFVCTLTAEFTPPLVEVRGSSHLVLCPIGYHLHENKSYFLMVTLDVLPGGLYELAFCLVEYDGDVDSEYQYWNSSEVQPLIPRQDRSAIRSILGAVTRYLLDSVKPEEVTMCTSEAHLPQKALIKYGLVCEVFADCGYVVSNYDEYHGQRVWRMVRQATV